MANYVCMYVCICTNDFYLQMIGFNIVSVQLCIKIKFYVQICIKNYFIIKKSRKTFHKIQIEYEKTKLHYITLHYITKYLSVSKLKVKVFPKKKKRNLKILIKNYNK